MRKAQRRRPSVESLEDRRLPATLGLAWPNPQHLTLSFAPDGTNVGGTPSVLFQSLNARLSTADWQLDILRAFQSWAAPGNLNIALSPDDGEPLGQPGPLQGNPGFGDIRITARPLSNNTLALSTPFDPTNKWSGEIVLNSLAPFGDGPKALEDLYSVMLYEAGHVLGLADSTAPVSAMNPSNTGVRTGLTAADAAAIQALYGSRQTTAANANTAFSTASPLSFVDASALSGSVPLSAPGTPALLARYVTTADVSRPTGAEVYSVTVPAADSGPFSAVVRTSRVSLLTPKVTIYDSQGRSVATSSAPDALHGDVTVTVAKPTPKTIYYVRVESARSDVFAVGTFNVIVGTSAQANLLAYAPSPLTGSNSAQVANTVFAQATTLTTKTPGTDARWPYTLTDVLGLTNPDETDYYAVKGLPTPGSSASDVMLVTVWGLKAGGLTPQISVFDTNHKAIAFQVVNSDASSETVQLTGVAPGTRYVVAVSAANPLGTNAIGGYFLGVDFLRQPITLDNAASGTLKASQSQQFSTVVVPVSELLHFNLTGDAGGALVPTAVGMTFFDPNFKAAYFLKAYGDRGSSSGDILLSAGTYTVMFSAATKDGSALPAMTYALKESVVSSPIGPNLIDNILNPVGPTSGGPTPVVPIWTMMPLYVPPPAVLVLIGPYSNPWMH